ncbi:hypothetical protein HN020_02720 [Brevibacillus borstelensis]|uniref:hypothetical protein n=1 Tax=Brevibacillus borstelensis TaxID=45462 RepID=UPI00148FC681|nr:hypothetical protein [Brevibacillus borstelensis]NOU53716.1 hypothetical protein [Brevibacillus borstelensis]
MARRSKPYITQFFNRDRLAFTAMFKTGHVSLEHLRSCGLVDSRIKNLIRDGHMEKVAYKKNGKTKECYKLTKSGRETAARLWGLSCAYHAQSPIHDLAIAEKYFSLPQELRESWKTETQIRHEFEEQISNMRKEGNEAEAKLYEDMLNKKLISMPDGIYTDSTGTEVAYEVLTNSYGIEELRSKETYVSIAGYRYETIRV